ncbi:hypothetical protein FDECE_14086 [Fusarium decemcellulare]|nr:hypothetical protein FDECE_14086 [Fusarium decemcellulare]
MSNPHNPEQILQHVIDAAESGDLAALKAALAEWDQVDDFEWFSRTFAELFIEQRHSIPERIFPLQRAFNKAAKNGHANVSAHLLEKGCVVTAPAVRYTFVRQHWDVAQLYLDSGWDINTPLEGGNTCPILKEVISSPERVRWCLEHGADPMFVSSGRNTSVLGNAGNMAHVETFRILKEHGVDFTKSNVLHRAAGSTRKGRVEVMAYLLDEAGANINQLEYEHDPDHFEGEHRIGEGTALHSAVRVKSAENIKFLIERGIDKDLVDWKGLKAVDKAREKDYAEGLALLE